MPRQNYPVGLQTFSEIIARGCVYVDKTDLIYSLTNGTPKYYFLSRPRRFGKSVLVSTLHAYFEGRKELFKGLKIEPLEKEWTAYPVLHFDMSTAKYMDEAGLRSELDRKLRQYEAIYGRDEGDTAANQRLQGLIERAYAKEQRGVVILIDEYDAPLLDVVHQKERLGALRQIMRNFYSPLKACSPYLRFVFLTGITKFSQLSIFSELNNLHNISMLDQYAALCGVTEAELLSDFRPGIEDLAEKMRITFDEAVARLKQKYDGYHFSAGSPDIYNPFSLLSALLDCELNYYWFGSGTPTYIVELLRKYHTIPTEIGNCDCGQEGFDVPPEEMTDVVPLLYQSGYLTIKDYDEWTGIYRLDIPNQEVRVGLMRNLLPEYLGAKSSPALLAMRKAQASMQRDDLDGALTWVRDFLATVPYCDRTHSEGHYQQVLYILFSLLGYGVDVELHTQRGRIDLVCMSRKRIYLMEIKVDKTADAALKQINLKDYAAKFRLSGLPVTKVGVNFDAEQGNISDWTQEEVE